ncbi:MULTISPECIES: DUF6999 family protein [unclassified Shewanella]|uniref:DUF6999 family protein n=1 Tax=unclassified Shewanella TaxID=196818 RepID=UPI000C857C4C|nr:MULTISPECIES: hypothetical protein [unclassified Shewanella]MDO6777062.1 hypothetical protein [Shewanella sp. 3_MG-2023]PMH86792.1 hypothetical protein BCU57_09755 [Shewanella sp. 10N.286.48.B5]
MASQSAFIRAISRDNSLPIEQAALDLWIKDLQNPFRWTLRPVLQLFFAMLLHLTWFLKRLPLPQFSSHSFLQKMICWFCKHLVSPEANLLILRHFSTESNVLNFLAENSVVEQLDVDNSQVASSRLDSGSKASSTNSLFVDLYPKCVDDMLRDTFVMHDQELFEAFYRLGNAKNAQPKEHAKLNWEHWQTINMDEFDLPRKRTQVIDFETAHALFMCLFCFLLKRDEYRDAINGFNLDQSIAIRIGRIIDKPEIVEMAYNKYPHYLVGPWNLSQRFLMHGFFTEYLYAELEQLRKTTELQ